MPAEMLSSPVLEDRVVVCTDGRLAMWHRVWALVALLVALQPVERNMSGAARAESQDAHAPVGESSRADHARTTHRFTDAKKWSAIWDDPARDEWQEPERVVALLELEPGMTVVDIGAGTGYFNARLSHAVGPDGIVYAVDVESTLVAHMAERAIAEETPNVRPILAAPDDPRIPAGRVDRILLVDTYHHIDARVAYFARLAERLAAGGRLVNVDWKPGDLGRGPRPEHKIHPDEVVAELRVAGYSLRRQEALAYQYVQVFERAGAD